MTDIREVVARALEDVLWRPMDGMMDFNPAADAAIAAARPLIESALMERLAERAMEKADMSFLNDPSVWWEDFADYLRAQPEAKGEQ